MKTRVLLLMVILSLCGWNAKAQYQFYPQPEEDMYDYMYVFDTNYIVNCFLSDDPFSFEFDWCWSNYSHEYVHHYTGKPYSMYYAELKYYTDLKRQFCDSTIPNVDGFVIGANRFNEERYAEAFAQEYYLEHMPRKFVVCGVAIKLNKSSLDEIRHLCILNQNFDTIAQTFFHTLHVIDPYTDERTPWNELGWNMYYFPYKYYDTLTNINDFRIAFDVPLYGHNTFRVTHTCNVYSSCIYDSIRARGGSFVTGYNLDTIFPGVLNPNAISYLQHSQFSEPYYDVLKNAGEPIPLCKYNDPKYLKHAGQWVLFEDDPVYDLYQNIYIAMVPIIMVPKSEGALSDVEMEKVCYLFPNPAKDYIKVLSHYTIKNIEIFDISGKLVAGKKVNTFEDTMDISNLPSGSYIVKIHTPKGIADKKLIIP